MNLTNSTDLLLLVIAIGIAGVGLLMLTVLIAAIYAGRLIGRLEEPVTTLGEKLDKVTGALDRFSAAATDDIRTLSSRVAALEKPSV